MTLEDIPVPQLGEGEVLVCVKACSLCGSDLHIIFDGITPTPYQPITLGSEPAGLIEEIGKGVKGWEKGQRVVIYPILYCGTCIKCVRGETNLCLSRKILGIHSEGAFAEYVKVRERNLIRLPESISFKEASIITDAVGTPFHALVGRGKFSPGDSVAVIGCGGIGTNAIKLARLFGASMIIAVDASDSALQRAREIGADVTINVSTENPVEKIKAFTDGQGVDISLECVGKKETITLSIQCLKIGGKAILIGLGPEPILLPPPTLFSRSEFSFLGSYGFTKDDVLRIMNLTLARKLDLKSSITHTFLLDEINQALVCLRDRIGNPSRIVITQK